LRERRAKRPVDLLAARDRNVEPALRRRHGKRGAALARQAGLDKLGETRQGPLDFRQDERAFRNGNDGVARAAVIADGHALLGAGRGEGRAAAALRHSRHERLDRGVEPARGERRDDLLALPDFIGLRPEILERAAAALLEMRAWRLHPLGGRRHDTEKFRAALAEIAHADTLARQREGHVKLALRRLRDAVAEMPERGDDDFELTHRAGPRMSPRSGIRGCRRRPRWGFR
jgi:hypothetical protein